MGLSNHTAALKDHASYTETCSPAPGDQTTLLRSGMETKPDLMPDDCVEAYKTRKGTSEGL